MDYDKFESEVIHPYFWTAQICRADHVSSQLQLTLAPGRVSFVDLLSALEEMDYNQSLHSLVSSATSTPSLDFLWLVLSVGTVQIALYGRVDSLRRGCLWSWVKVEGQGLLRASVGLGIILF